MNIEQLRKFCLSFPSATEDVKWGADLCFSVGTKMFAVTSADTSSGGLSFKCTPEIFNELIERDGIKLAAYVGRYKWVHLDSMDTIAADELKALLRQSYQLVFDKLPSKVKNNLSTT